MASERVVAQKAREAKKVKTQKRKEAPETSRAEEVTREKRQAISTTSETIDKASATPPNPPIGFTDLVYSSMHKGEKTLPPKRVRFEGDGDI